MIFKSKIIYFKCKCHGGYDGDPDDFTVVLEKSVDKVVSKFLVKSLEMKFIEYFWFDYNKSFRYIGKYSNK